MDELMKMEIYNQVLIMKILSLLGMPDEDIDDFSRKVGENIEKKYENFKKTRQNNET